MSNRATTRSKAPLTGRSSFTGVAKRPSKKDLNLVAEKILKSVEERMEPASGSQTHGPTAELNEAMEVDASSDEFSSPDPGSPAQSEPASGRSTPRSEHESDDDKSFIAFNHEEDIEAISKGLEKISIGKKGEILGLITVSAGHIWQVLRYGEKGMYDYGIERFMSSQDLKRMNPQPDYNKPLVKEKYFFDPSNTLQLHQRQDLLHKLNWLDYHAVGGKSEKNKTDGKWKKLSINKFKGIATIESLSGAFVPIEDNKVAMDTDNIRILVEWKKKGGENESSWEKVGTLRKKWADWKMRQDARIDKVTIKREETTETTETTNKGKKKKRKANKKRKSAPILAHVKNDIEFQHEVYLKAGALLDTIQWAFFDTRFRCLKRVQEASKSSTDDIKERYATPAFGGPNIEERSSSRKVQLKDGRSEYIKGSKMEIVKEDADEEL